MPYEARQPSQCDTVPIHAKRKTLEDERTVFVNLYVDPSVNLAEGFFILKAKVARLDPKSTRWPDSKVLFQLSTKGQK